MIAMQHQLGAIAISAWVVARPLHWARAFSTPAGDAMNEAAGCKCAALVTAHRWLNWAFCCALCCLLLSGEGCSRVSPPEPNARRIVSLSPALTETMFALGVDPEVVGVSDFCHAPPAVETRPRVGTIFSPKFEAIVQVRPTLIVAERIAGTRVEDLAKLSETATYPWLTYDDVIQSTGALGRKLGRGPAAERLIESYRSVLAIPAATLRPRVFLALAHVPGQLGEVWFIRRNSIHGRALEAVGAENAVARDIIGPPRIGLEAVIALDPEAIIVLEPVEHGHPGLLDDWRRITALQAIRQGRLALIAAPELEVPGPRIEQFVKRLRQTLRAMNPAPPKARAASQAIGGNPL